MNHTKQKMKFLKNLLGITKLENKIKQNTKQIAKLIKPTQTKNHETKILKILKVPTSTIDISKKLKIGRSYASKILNQLEKENKIYEHSKKQKTILYKKR